MRFLALILLIPSLVFPDASLTFGGATSDTVSLGTSGAAFTKCTGVMWVRPTTLAQFSMMFSRAGTALGSEAPSFALGSASGNQLRVKWAGTTATQFVSANANLTTNKWWFVAFTMDQSVTPNVHFYVGDQATLPTETTYTTQTNGATWNSNSGKEIQIGNLVGDVLPWAGQIAVSAMWTRVLTLSEIQDQKDCPHETSGLLFFHRLGFKGTSTQPDYSGNGLDGTVTGTAVSALGPPICIGGSPQ